MEELPTVPRSLPCKPHCLCQKHVEFVTQDNRLLAWENNQRNMERIRHHLSNKIERPECNLLMNTIDHHRAIQEHRMLMTYAKVPCHFDKYRGNPAFWKMPTQLYKRCNEAQNYFAQMTKMERNEIPSIEYIRVPREKHEIPSRISSKNLIDCEYCLKRLDSCTLRMIQPHKPILDDLAIRGMAMQSQYSNEDFLHCFKLEQSVTDLSKFCTASSSKQFALPTPQSYCCLMVNDKMVMSDSQGHVETSVIFGGPCDMSTQSHYLFIENKGNLSLRIYFNEMVVVRKFSSNRKESSSVRRFFFNRNYHILQQEQKCNIPFWFKSQTCGYFEFALKMIVLPDLWNGKLQIFVTLKASADDKVRDSICLSYDNMIQNRMRSRLIADCLNDMMKAIPCVESSIKLYTYNKATIFEVMNSTYDPLHERTKYLYSKEIVDELEAFYESVRLPHHAEIWSLNLNDLRAVTKDREAFDKAKSLEDSLSNILQTIEKNKAARLEAAEILEKIWQNSDAKSKKAINLVKKDKSEKKAKPKSAKDSGSPIKKGKHDRRVVSREPTREPMPETLSGHLESIILKLKSPTTFKNEQSKRLKACYNLLCVYIDKICADIKTMPFNNFPAPSAAREIQKVRFNPDRIVTEELVWMENEIPAFSEFIKTKSMQPQPEWSLEVPMTDYEARFKAFQGETVTSIDKRSKKGLDSKSPKVGSKKSDIMSSRSRSGRHSRHESIQSSARVTIEETFLQSATHIEDTPFTIPEDKLDHYRNNIFVLFYKHLCDFVDDLEAVFETFPGPDLPHDVLQRINQSQFARLQQDNRLKIEVVNVKQKISQILKWGVKEERTEPLYARMYKRILPPPDAMESSSSVWNVLKAYFPAQPRLEPKHEGDVFVHRQKLGKKVDLVDQDTEVTPDEVITERMIQTSLCSDVSVTFNASSWKSESKSEVCVCKPVDRVPCNFKKHVTDFHNSDCFMSSDADSDSAMDADD